MWPILGLSWNPFEPVWGHVGLLEAILAETGFVYERSEGLAELQKIIRVCQKEEIAA